MTLFLGGAALLLTGAVTSALTAAPLERGWYLVADGAVYLSDGARGLCSYPSWERFVAAGGKHGAWQELSRFPLRHRDMGPCPVREGRLDWLPAGSLGNAFPLSALWSDGRGHVCRTREVWVAASALPEGTVQIGDCPKSTPPPARVWGAAQSF